MFQWQFLITYASPSVLHHESIEWVHSKKCFFMFTETFFAFLLLLLLLLFLLFFIKNLCFYHFHFFFRWNIKFRKQKINQSETEIGNEKLSMELYNYILKIRYIKSIKRSLTNQLSKCLLMNLNSSGINGMALVMYD